MPKPTRKRLLIATGGIVVILAAVCIVVALCVPHEQVRTVIGTITHINLATRTATIEFIHPKSGRTLAIDGTAPPDCDIRIDGQPAQLTDLRIGEEVEVEGTIHGDMTITANWVRVARAGRPATTTPTTTHSTTDP